MDVLAKTVLILGLVALILFFLVYGAGIFIPLAVALLLWFFINALANAYHRAALGLFDMPRALALMLALATIFGASLLAINVVVGNLADMGAQAVDFEAALDRLIESTATFTGIKSHDLMDQILNLVGVEALLSNILATMANLASQFSIVFLYVIFLMVEQQLFNVKLRAVIPDEERRTHLRAMLGRIAEDVQSYLWIMTLVSALTGVLAYGVMLLIGLDHAFFWAFLIFVLNFIPTIGSIVSTALPALYALLQFPTFGPFLWVLLGVGAIQFVIGNVVQPRVAAQRLNLSQFVVILALFVWGAIWGIVGMFLAVPIMAILMIVLANIEATRPVAMLLSETGDIGKESQDGARPSD